jgi:hypothetical protein
MTIDEFVKLASMVGGIFVGVAAVIAYYETASRELKKPFNDAQLSLCREASDTAATLASVAPRPSVNALGPTEKIEDAWQLARIRFEQLYWGSLAIVENGDVEAKMVRFRGMLIPRESEIRAGSLADAQRSSLQQAALNISHACRALVSESWQLKLPILPGKPLN